MSDAALSGLVSLVGAGPGDPGLITARGRERLERAEVVVHDALLDPVLLERAPAAAERVDAGKRAREHRLSQQQINDLLVARARAGKRVVRLKGGDPYLFGRGAEEAMHLAEHGVAFELVPGVTAGAAAPAAAGIPVTRRGMSSAVAFITGHEDPTKAETALDYEALAALVAAGGTLCVYMGVSRLGAIADRLVRAGLAATCAAAVVQSGTLPAQRSVRGELGSIADRAAEAGVAAPAIVVIGEVAGIRAPVPAPAGPLAGRSVLLTRPGGQAAAGRAALEALGARVWEAPAIEPTDPPDPEAARAAIRGLPEHDWLVVTSANGVRSLLERLRELGLDSRHLAGVRVAAIGAATERALAEELGIRADLVPPRFVAEALADELAARAELAGARFLLFRAAEARPVLGERLEAAGATVTAVAAYALARPARLPAGAAAALRAGAVDWITFTSASTVENFLALLGEAGEGMGGARIASIGPVTTRKLAEHGLTPDVEADRHDMDGLVAAIRAAES